MGKKSKTQSKDVAQSGKTDAPLPFLGGNASIDPSLASLFEQSAGPVKAPVQTFIPQNKDEGEDADNDEELSELEEELASEDDEDMQDASEDADELDITPVSEAQAASGKKRKRVAAEEVEETYMRRIAKEEQKEEEKRRADKAKRQKVEEDKDAEKSADESADESADDDEESSEGEEEIIVPKHESQSGDKGSTELEKSNRTVFLSNVSNEAIKSKSGKKTLLKHLASFLSTLPESTGPHKVESIRFRSVAFASGGKVPKRADFARRDVLDDTTPSTNAYAVYSTVQAARKAPAALNGTIVLDRHLRVDSIAHPSPVDNKRCVFVGNLDFVDNETNPDEDERKKKKRSPADVEEGLWRTFNAQTKGSNDKSSPRGNVESVRVVRDPITRVGKGFAYVQFYDANCVEQALLLDGKRFPPMLPRKLRVTRAKKISKKRDGPETSARDRKLGEAFTTLQGRAGKLFGKAGAANFKAGERRSVAQNSVVFEGHRATEGSASRIKVKTKSRGSKGKPKNRSSKRAAAYQAAGGRKGKIAAKAAN